MQRVGKAHPHAALNASWRSLLGTALCAPFWAQGFNSPAIGNQVEGGDSKRSSFFLSVTLLLPVGAVTGTPSDTANANTNFCPLSLLATSQP